MNTDRELLLVDCPAPSCGALLGTPCARHTPAHASLRRHAARQLSLRERIRNAFRVAVARCPENRDGLSADAVFAGAYASGLLAALHRAADTEYSEAGDCDTIGAVLDVIDPHGERE